MDSKRVGDHIILSLRSSLLLELFTSSILTIFNLFDISVSKRVYFGYVDFCISSLSTSDIMRLCCKLYAAITWLYILKGLLLLLSSINVLFFLLVCFALGCILSDINITTPDVF